MKPHSPNHWLITPKGGEPNPSTGNAPIIKLCNPITFKIK